MMCTPEAIFVQKIRENGGFGGYRGCNFGSIKRGRGYEMEALMP